MRRSVLLFALVLGFAGLGFVIQPVKAQAHGAVVYRTYVGYGYPYAYRYRGVYPYAFGYRRYVGPRVVVGPRGVFVKGAGVIIRRPGYHYGWRY
jgi:hypothetical protein